MLVFLMFFKYCFGTATESPTSHDCPTFYFACSEGCIPSYYVCDGTNNCVDGRDEAHCKCNAISLDTNLQ